MNQLSHCSMQFGRCGWAIGALGFALALCACAHDGGDDVKPTATTAYHSAAPAAPPAGTSAAPAQPKE